VKSDKNSETVFLRQHRPTPSSGEDAFLRRGLTPTLSDASVK